mmetsp:Transcript_21054/g.50002  ORF Transcript_21054/g.50002 Transcript_21054/m.50002 type:complete len:310 (+) Transcript_21054:1428-2357(+)
MVPRVRVGRVDPDFLLAKTLVVDRVKRNHLLEEERNLGMGFGVASRLEERLEDIGHHRREVVHILDRLAMDVIQPRDLDHPSVVVAVEFVVVDPRGQLLPLVLVAAVDRDPELCHLVLVLFVVRKQLLRDLAQIDTPDHVVCLEEDLTEPRRAARVVLEVEAIEAMQGGVVCVDIKHVEREVVVCQVQRLEDLSQRQVLAIAVDDDAIAVALELLLDEAQQMLRVHARAVVDVRVHLADVVKVAMRVDLACPHFLFFVEQQVKLEHRFEVQQPPRREKVDRRRADDLHCASQVIKELGTGCRDRTLHAP